MLIADGVRKLQTSHDILWRGVLRVTTIYLILTPLTHNLKHKPMRGINKASYYKSIH